MRLRPTPLSGAQIIEPEWQTDERGAFGRVFCAQTFQTWGLDFQIAQQSISLSPHAGTLRGLHYQVPTHAEAKLIRCGRGAVHDVLVDLRPASPTHRHWFAVELSAENHRQIYVPAGCAHGFLTLTDDVEMIYQMNAPHVPAAARGVRFDDPAFGIAWPFAPKLIAERDRGYPDYRT